METFDINIYDNVNLVDYFKEKLDFAKKAILTVVPNERVLMITSLMKDTVNEALQTNNNFFMSDLTLFSVINQKVKAQNDVRKKNNLPNLEYVSLVEFAYILKTFDELFQVKKIIANAETRSNNHGIN